MAEHVTPFDPDSILFHVMQGNALTGTLPPEWSGMAALRTLLLGTNQLRGSVPSMYVGAVPLSRLSLIGNSQMCGLLPGEWATGNTVQVGSYHGGIVNDRLSMCMRFSGH